MSIEDPVDAFVPGTRVRVEGASDGPLAGLTFAAKDLFDVAGVATGGGNPDWAAGQSRARQTRLGRADPARRGRGPSRQDRHRRDFPRHPRREPVLRNTNQQRRTRSRARRIVIRLGGGGGGPVSATSPSVPIPAARYACRPVSAVCSASARPTAASPSAAWRARRRAPTPPAGWPAMARPSPRPRPVLLGEAHPGRDAEPPDCRRRCLRFRR